MSAQEQFSQSSWCVGKSPEILTEVFSPDTSVAVWERENDVGIRNYFEQVFDSLGLGIRTVFSMESLKEGLYDSLPSGTGKKEAVDDIYLLSDMLTCLFDCQSVGLRLAPLKAAMCPKFHVDNIPVRLVNTYLGAGTEWLPQEFILDNISQQGTAELTNSLKGNFYHPKHIQQLCSFDVALLKGSAWDSEENKAAIHRSCQVNANDKRVLLTLDPM